MVLLALLLAASGAREPEEVWHLDLHAPSFGSGAIADLDGDGAPEIAFGTYFGDARLRVVRAATGEVLFERPSAGGPFDASVAVHDGAALVADSATGTLFAYGADGGERWRLALPSGTDSPIGRATISAEGRVALVVGTMTVNRGPGRVVCFDPDTRETIWSAELSAHVQTGPAAYDLDGDGVDEILAGTWRGDGNLTCLDGATGAARWTVEIGDQYHAPAVGELGGRVSIVTCGLEDRIVCLDADGAIRWERRFEGEYLFAPTTLLDVDGDGELEIAAIGRRAHLLRADGTTMWELDLDWPAARGATPVDLDGDGAEDLLFGAGTRLYAVRGRDGVVVWRFDAKCGESPYEDIDSAVLLANVAGDEDLEAFFVDGAGTSENEGRDNYGRAYLLHLPGVRGPAWRFFRGSLRHVGNTRVRD